MKSSHVYLIGMPGSGKTTTGRELAAHCHLPFVDLDAEIVVRAGQLIPAIFLNHGEARFRQLEAEALLDVAARPGPQVVATGGGTPCFEENLAVLLATGFVVWLDVPVPVLAQRLAAAAETARRPLLATSGPSERWLQETLVARQRFYARAPLCCTGPTCTVGALAAQLAAAGFGPLAA